MRIGIIGGTFNPIHYGHLRSTEEVRKALLLDEIRFIPSALPPHKPQDEVAAAADRLEMVRIALEDYPAYVCDPIEVERGGPSYTLDTLEELERRTSAEIDMFFIIGADAFLELSTWHKPQEVLNAVNFAVTLRGDQNTPEYLEALLRVIQEIEPGYCMDKSLKEAEFTDRKRVIKFVPITEVDISATRIRQCIKGSCSINHLLPREVEIFIIRRRLYGHSGIVN
ncbi:MAG: nicotinate-nucleotide adenylyltransferase [Nitrospinae bacterium]|nr:nicotinate-nucleotide adenylyltransferase [Nitrospinota bacterium]